MKTPIQHPRRYYGTFIFNFEQIPHIVLVFAIVGLEQVNEGWVYIFL